MQIEKNRQRWAKCVLRLLPLNVALNSPLDPYRRVKNFQ